MSLLDRVQSDFSALLLNPSDFGTTVQYTPAGSSTASALSCVVIPEESRQESQSGLLVRIDRIHVSALRAAFAPSHGAKVSYDGRDWDFASLEHDAGGGFNGAYFESVSINGAGPFDVSPV